ncbi:MAG: hypothetical protein ACOC26_02280 [Halochromatium sp.]
MEFFATAQCRFTPDHIQDQVTGPRLTEFCASIDRVLEWSDAQDAGEVYCLWGQFRVRRERIRDGVRFTLPGCPNALAWTITATPEGTLIHCTINRCEHEPDFIESIEEFIADWVQGLDRDSALGH